jgi:SAM-dependent methyltransferase
MFFTFYSLFLTREKKYAHCFLRLVTAVDGLVKFKFLRELARKQHDAFGLKDEKRILALTGNNVLDIGSGLGYWGLLLKDYGRKTVAIEIYQPYLRLTKMLEAYGAVIKGSANALPLKPNCFDTALAIEVIEHVNKQHGYLLLKEAKRVSKSVIVTTPRYYSSNLNLPRRVPETERHLSYWTEQDFKTDGFKTSTLGRSILALHFERQDAGCDSAHNNEH